MSDDHDPSPSPPTFSSIGLIHPSGINVDQAEKVPTHVYSTPSHACQSAASYVAQRILEHSKSPSHSKPFVLGVSVHSAVVGVYEALAKVAASRDGFSFSNVVFVELQEWHGISPTARQCFHKWLNDHFYSLIDARPENILWFNPEDDSDAAAKKLCTAHKSRLLENGGIDILLCSIGPKGSIAFNEPIEAKRTHRSHGVEWRTARYSQRKRAASSFFGIENVPRKLFNVELKFLMDVSKEVLFFAFTEGACKGILPLIEGDATPSYPASMFQKHTSVTVFVDEAAGELLSRCYNPWLLVGSDLTFDSFLERKAVIWLALRLEKPILRLTEDDYVENGLVQLLQKRGSPYDINIRVFRHVSSTITGWPGGKKGGKTSGSIISTFPKRVIVFSPHPDDDVISMGGTLIRLVEQGHNVHVCYQTSGNFAVWNHDVLRHTHFVRLFCEKFDLAGGKDGEAKLAKFEEDIQTAIDSKSTGDVDAQKVRHIKGLIRATEARSAALACGVRSKNIHHLNLPFYETGTVKKNPVGEVDCEMVAELLRDVKPHQIYAAGDLSDPHGTHRQCLMAIFRALTNNLAGEKWLNECEVWLYRGAWQEWEPEKISMAVPMSPAEVEKKRLAIFRHESQKDIAPFPGGDKREFWQRSEARNRATAEMYDNLGLTEYEAMEAFVRWDIFDQKLAYKKEGK